MLDEKDIHVAKIRNRIWAGVGIALLLATVFFVGLSVYWLNASEEVIKLNKSITVRPPVTPQETLIFVSFDYCKTQHASGILSRRLVSDRQEIISQTGVPEETAPGCATTEQTILLPHQAEPGTYRVKYVINYQINPFKQTIVTLLSEPFVIK